MPKFIVLLLILLMVQFSKAQESPTPSPTWTPTATWTATSSWTPTATWTATATWTPTETWTASATWTSTWTPVVQTVVVTQAPQIIHSVVTVPPIVITVAPVLPALPALAVNLAESVPQVLPTQLTPFYGWRRYQSIHLIAVVGQWGIFDDTRASARQYRQSANADVIARYPFEGEGLRLAYKMQEQGCPFDLRDRL